jgi:hypothetical protein
MAFARLRESNPEFGMSVSFPGAFSTPAPTSSLNQQKSASLAAKSPDSVVQQFLEYAKMTPAERLHAQMLARLGLTEDQFKAMSPADQQKIEDKIREMIKQQVANSTDKPTGVITDKSV